eukprot:scaffold27253_cov73-Phaeocystis_antarctica.AAC.5
MASAAFCVTAHMSTCSESRVGACNLEALNAMLAMAAATAASDVADNGPIVHAIVLWLRHVQPLRAAAARCFGTNLAGSSSVLLTTAPTRPACFDNS